MNNLNEFLNIGNSVVKDLFAKVEKAKEHLSEEQRNTLNKELTKASKDITKATDLLKELKTKMND